MRARVICFLVCVGTLAVCLVLLTRHGGPVHPAPGLAQETAARELSSLAPPRGLGSKTAHRTQHSAVAETRVSELLPQLAPETRLERLAQIREQFRSLATGDARTALMAARQLTNQVERETALLTLVTQWTQGELSPPQQRAWNIARFGLEAGLGMELAKNPDLAVEWAKDLTDGPGRAALLQQTAIAQLDSDPGAAFALGQQVPPQERPQFTNAVFAGWAWKNTDAALWSAQQLPNPAARDAAVGAIRNVAPVGIGAVLSSGQGGYPVINGLVPGAPAQLSGLLHPGDSIVGVAQGDNPFLDTHGLPLQQVVQMIRGEPGTLLQIQVIGAGTPAGSPPQTVSIVRDQVKFKR